MSDKNLYSKLMVDVVIGPVLDKVRKACTVMYKKNPFMKVTSHVIILSAAVLLSG